MGGNTKQALKELIEKYGVSILDDPDRLSQFLEDRCPSDSAGNFRLTFALRYLLKSGWTPKANNKFTYTNDTSYISRLCENLGFSEADAETVMDLLNDVITEQLDDSSLDENEMVIAKPGNLRRISGGISNKPRTMWIRKKSFYNGLVLVAALLAITVLFFQIGSQRNPVGDEFRIAFFAPMSGAYGQSSQNELRAAQLAVELINKKGGVRGYKLKIVGYDLPLIPQAAYESVRNAMKDKSILVMMTGTAGNIIDVISPIADDINVPLIITAPEVQMNSLMKGDRPYLYSFHIANDTDARAKMLAYFATQGLSKKNIGLLYNSAEYISLNLHDSLLRWIKIFGGKVTVDFNNSNINTYDYATAIEAIVHSGPEILIIAGRQKNIATLFKQVRAAGFNNPILAEGYSETVTPGAGVTFAGSWWLSEVSGLDPQIRSVLKEYRTLYNENCPPANVEAAILAYDGVQWIASALYQASGYRGEAVRHALLSTRNFPMTHGTLSIDPRTHGPLNKAMALIYCATENGIFQRRIRTRKTE